MYHYQPNVMGEQLAADCGKIAASADVRLHWPAARTRHLVFYVSMRQTTKCKHFNKIAVASAHFESGMPDVNPGEVCVNLFLVRLLLYISIFRWTGNIK